MLDLQACDRSAAESGLGRRQQVHRVVRHVPYALRGFAYIAVVFLLAVLTQANPWGLLASVILIGCAEAAILLVPLTKGAAALIRHEGGLILALADGQISPLPWNAIADCVFKPGSQERSLGSTRIYFAQFHLYLRGIPRPLVLIHLRKAKQLAAAVNQALEPFRLGRLLEEFARTGRVDLGGKVIVTREGLIIGTNWRHRTTPLPWGELTEVRHSPPSTLVFRSALLRDDADGARVQIDGSSGIAGQFIAEVWKAAVGAAGPAGDETA